MSDLKYIWGYNNLYNSKKLIGIVNKGNKKVNKKGNLNNSNTQNSIYAPRLLTTEVEGKYKLLWKTDGVDSTPPSNVTINGNNRSVTVYSYSYEGSRFAADTSETQYFSYCYLCGKNGDKITYTFNDKTTLFTIGGDSNSSDYTTILFMADHGISGNSDWCCPSGYPSIINDIINKCEIDKNSNSNKYAAALIMAGDISYATGSNQRWESYDAEMSEKITSYIPCLFAHGNHDYYFPSALGSNEEGGGPLAFRYNQNSEDAVVPNSTGNDSFPVDPQNLYNTYGKEGEKLTEPIDSRFTIHKAQINNVGMIAVNTSSQNKEDDPDNFNDNDKEFIIDCIKNFSNNTDIHYIIIIGHTGKQYDFGFRISTLLYNLDDGASLKKVNLILSGHVHRNARYASEDNTEPMEYMWGSSGYDNGGQGKPPSIDGATTGISPDTDVHKPEKYTNFYTEKVENNDDFTQDSIANKLGIGYLRLNFPKSPTDNKIIVEAISIQHSGDGSQYYDVWEDDISPPMEDYIHPPTDTESIKRRFKYWGEHVH